MSSCSAGLKRTTNGAVAMGVRGEARNGRDVVPVPQGGCEAPGRLCDAWWTTS